jgi:hypothetical protein
MTHKEMSPRVEGVEYAECMVAHNDEHDGGCWYCEGCLQWIRPHKWNQECIRRDDAGKAKRWTKEKGWEVIDV